MPTYFKILTFEKGFIVKLNNLVCSVVGSRISIGKLEVLINLLYYPTALPQPVREKSHPLEISSSGQPQII